MSLDLHPDIERQVLVRAQAAGVTPSDYVAGLLGAATPSGATDPVERVRELLQEWQRHDRIPTAPAPPGDGTMTPSKALFRQWEQEDAGMNEDERRAAEARWTCR